MECSNIVIILPHNPAIVDFTSDSVVTVFFGLILCMHIKSTRTLCVHKIRHELLRIAVKEFRTDNRFIQQFSWAHTKFHTNVKLCLPSPDSIFQVQQRL